MRILILGFTHIVMLAIGFAIGIYTLPILTAETADQTQLAQDAQSAQFTTQLTRDLKGSDGLHWGEGQISISPTNIVHQGKLSPGPDYKVYLSRQFVEDEDEFEAVKAQSVRLGDIKSFDGFSVPVPVGVDVSDYNTVVVWCERFGEFITAGQYK